MRIRSVCVWFLLASTISASSVLAAVDPLEVIPANASVVMRVKSPRQTIDNSLELVQKADPQTAQQLKQMALQIGLLIGNPQGVGVDPRRDWYFASFMRSEGEPILVYMMPATNTQQMHAAIARANASFKFVEHEKWLIYSGNTQIINQIRALASGRGPSIASTMDEESRGVLDNNDVSVYLNMSPLREAYRIELDAAKNELKETLENLEEKAPVVEGANLEEVYNIYGDVITGLLNAVEDIQAVTIGGSVSNRGVETTQYLRVKADSPTDKFLQSHQPSDFAVLSQLPGDQLMYAGFHVNPEGFIDLVQKLVAAVAESGDPQSAEIARKIHEAMQEYTGLKYGEMMATFDLGKVDAGVIRYVNVLKITPTETVKKLYRTLYQDQSVTDNPAMEVVYTPDAEAYGAHKGDLIVNRIKDQSADPAGVQQMLFGPDGMETRIVFTPDMVIQTMGGGQPLMEQTVAALTGTSEDTTSSRRLGPMQATRRRLSEKANLIVLIDIPRLVSEGFNVATQAGAPIPIDGRLLEDLGEKPSYSGITVSTEPAGLRIQTNVPAAQILGLVKIAKVMQELQQQSEPNRGEFPNEFDPNEFNPNDCQ